MPKKPVSKEQKAFRFYNSAAGHVVLTAIIWVIGFNLFLLATDTGSLLQWAGVIICLFWGLHHLIVAISVTTKRLWHKQKKSA